MMQPRQRTITGWFFTVTGILACPCHLVVTLPLAVALLGGTALGGWIATHEGAIALGATLYFVGALGLGATLLLAQASRHTAGTDGADAAASRAAARQMTAAACCPPDLSFDTPAGEAIRETTRYAARDAERAEAEGLGSR